MVTSQCSSPWSLPGPSSYDALKKSRVWNEWINSLILVTAVKCTSSGTYRWWAGWAPPVCQRRAPVPCRLPWLRPPRPGWSPPCTRAAGSPWKKRAPALQHNLLSTLGRNDIMKKNIAEPLSPTGCPPCQPPCPSHEKRNGEGNPPISSTGSSLFLTAQLEH